MTSRPSWFDDVKGCAKIINKYRGDLSYFLNFYLQYYTHNIKLTYISSITNGYEYTPGSSTLSEIKKLSLAFFNVYFVKF